jgi:Ni2+-binding GTPase involved in maturation of urease and hydrogenase
MKVITVAGPPASGKTSVLLHAIQHLKAAGGHPCVMKFDCLITEDDQLYRSIGVECKVGLSGSLCPDHYFVSNIEACVTWAREQGYDMLISESAGLCNRCSPHIEGVCAVCVIDNLAGINTPKKVGPMLKMADIVVITKGDVVSQAEREIFSFRVLQANPNALIIPVNGITGQGAREFASSLQGAAQKNSLIESKLRVSMPAALCSYCLGDLRIGSGEQLSKSQIMVLD